MSRSDGDAGETPVPRRSYELAISEPLFRLATESVHLLSNETKVFATLGAVVASRAGRACEGFLGQSDDTLLGHLSSLPTAGAVGITIAVDAGTAARLETARTQLAARLDRALELADVVSMLLFDLTVERASAAILDRLLGSDAPPSARGKPHPTPDPSGKVVPIR